MMPTVLAVGHGLGGEGLTQLALAVLLGGLIGLEREFHGRPAGLRTHILVCLGSTIAMVAAAHLYRAAPALGLPAAVQLDLGRVAAGVLTGIGFIGAGAIMRLRGTHRGLTTAACIWLVAGIGLALGLRAYLVAGVGTALALAVLMLLDQLERLIAANTYRELAVVAELRDDVFEGVGRRIEEMGLETLSREFRQDLDRGQIEMTFHVKYRGADQAERVADGLRELPGVRSISWRLVGS